MKTEQILDIFQSYRMGEIPGDQYQEKGKALLAAKIDKHIAANSPIPFVMLGFPMKSGNQRDKVIGNLPDFAEEVALKNFNQFGNQIKEVYSPGIDFQIISDGYAFNDILGIANHTVAAYQEVGQDMITSINAPVSWYNLTDFYNSKTSLPSARTKLMEQFAVSEIELQNRILNDPDVNILYRGMIHFMQEELAPNGYPSRNQLQVAAKKLTREMMMRNEAYSQLIRSEFDSSIRLSMHHSLNNGSKYSFQLVPGTNAKHSPWHCVLALENGEYITMHKKDAEALGLELIYKNGRPYFYQGNQIF